MELPRPPAAFPFPELSQGWEEMQELVSLHGEAAPMLDLKPGLAKSEEGAEAALGAPTAMGASPSPLGWPGRNGALPPRRNYPGHWEMGSAQGKGKAQIPRDE